MGRGSAWPIHVVVPVSYTHLDVYKRQMQVMDQLLLQGLIQTVQIAQVVLVGGAIEHPT